MEKLSGFKEFEFALSEALILQLVECLNNMGTSPLNPILASQVPDKQGVYQLFHKGKLVYIGKTDAKKGLQHRLTRHAAKILSRVGLSAGDVQFKAVQVLVFSAVDLEKMLIKHFTKIGQKPDWNHSGFGSNDPGRRREDSALKAGHFDIQYPIDLGTCISADIKEGMILPEALIALRRALPFRFRFADSKKDKRELQRKIVHQGAAGSTAADFLKIIGDSLPQGWQITIFPGYVIAYPETRDYKFGTVFIRT